MYDAGACVYFYFGFNYRGVGNPVKLYEEIEVKHTSSYLWNTDSEHKSVIIYGTPTELNICTATVIYLPIIYYELSTA